MGVFSLVFFKINLFIHFFVSVMNDSWLLRVDFSLVVASRGYSSLWCMGFSLQRLLLLWSMVLRCMGFNSCGPQA